MNNLHRYDTLAMIHGTVLLRTNSQICRVNKFIAARLIHFENLLELRLIPSLFFSPRTSAYAHSYSSGRNIATKQSAGNETRLLIGRPSRPRANGSTRPLFAFALSAVCLAYRVVCRAISDSSSRTRLSIATVIAFPVHSRVSGFTFDNQLRRLPRGSFLTVASQPMASLNNSIISCKVLFLHAL